MIHAPTTMLSIVKTATKESLFYKLPTLVGDIIIQVGVLVFLLYGTGMVRENNLPLYEQTGSWFLLVVSTIAATDAAMDKEVQFWD